MVVREHAYSKKTSMRKTVANEVRQSRSLGIGNVRSSLNSGYVGTVELA